METTTKVSVIIPVYNAEKFVEKCVVSLMEQTLADGIEFIFVDDNSPDNSVDIIRKTVALYPHRVSHTKIVTQKDGRGVSAARTLGMANASGEYLIHCDSDDWVEADAYESMLTVAMAQSADLVVCDFCLNGAREVIKSQKPDECSSESLLASISGASQKVIHGSLWNKLIRKTLCDKAKFPEGVNYCEDVFLLFQILKEDIKIAYLPRGLYHYRVNPKSLVNTLPESRKTECVELMRLISEMRDDSRSDSFSRACEAKIAGLIHYLCSVDMLNCMALKGEFTNYRGFLNSNNQITETERKYIVNFMEGRVVKAFVESKICRYRMIARNLWKRYVG